MAKTVRAPSLSEDQALDKARQAVRERDSFADSAKYSIEPDGASGWTVTVNAGGGEERLILLNDQGDIVLYEGG